MKLLATQIGDDDVAALAVALASGRNTRPLTLDLSENELTLASIKLLLTALGACHNVTLYVNEDELTPTIRALMEQHHLVETSVGVLVSPTRASSPWHAM
ncbi:hypothetical protein SPRG_20841 [Saprolegnia parasitica CBS 223.65]|uniref:Uncharacterized protein n=1 Tax=Saprolegnia parasitica (strain CBS 223.65) TaxID=695850 RepID=A0A067CEJ1_SAPPC|nr:hypothetical protein SPRG_20841 [Saprolegnia parasitica CBS 223.65]KDO24976.1 hypothetical protein SPRG_20841 [Saprolegnia parasitica CBS 223.65]|eukprot:XP_012204324.1 hypothetical protein SPRG_20841 [Saprolegnia parasitica CBS 223.65]